VSSLYDNRGMRTLLLLAMLLATSACGPANPNKELCDASFAAIEAKGAGLSNGMTVTQSRAVMGPPFAHFDHYPTVDSANTADDYTVYETDSMSSICGHYWVVFSGGALTSHSSQRLY
jgi:hypothetical protein